MEVAKPGSEVRITQVVKNDTSKDQSPLGLASTLVKNVKLAGLINIKDPITIDISPDTKKDIEMKFQLSTNSEFEVIEIVCQAPNFESGSSQLLSFAKKVEEKKRQANSATKNDTKNATTAEKAAIWSLDDLDDDEVDLIDPDTLIDEEDLKKPEAASLRGSLLI